MPLGHCMPCSASEMSQDVVVPALLRFDGGSRGNPGRAGCGFVLIMNPNASDEEKLTGSFYLGNRQTNNYAEYVGLIEGLKKAIAVGVTDIHVEGDSLLVISQMSSQWNVNAPNIIPLFTKASELLSHFSRCSLTHIPRSQNKEADSLANQAMDHPNVHRWEGLM